MLSHVPSKIIQLDKNFVSLHRWGTGDELLIALPGYGQKATAFKDWINPLEHLFTCYVIDLPLHGNTTWNEALFTPQHLVRILQIIREMHPEKPLSIAAFSMGGRLILNALPSLPDGCKRLFLIAPDGFYTPGLSIFIQFAILLRPLALKLIMLPSLPNKVITLLYHLKLINRRNYLFLNRQFLKDYRKKRLAFWINSITRLHLSAQEIVRLLPQKSNRIILIGGKQDQVVPLKTLQKIHKKVPGSILEIVDSNHQILEFGIGNRIKSWLQEES